MNAFILLVLSGIFFNLIFYSVDRYQERIGIIRPPEFIKEKLLRIMFLLIPYSCIYSEVVKDISCELRFIKK